MEKTQIYRNILIIFFKFQWEDPRISNPTIAGPAIPYNRDYKRKYEYLKQQLKKPNNVPNKFEIKVKYLKQLEQSECDFSQVL